MKRVQLHLPPGGVHPVYELLTDSSCVDRASAIHWNVAEDGTLTMLHRLVGDIGAVADRLAEIEPIREYELFPIAESSTAGSSGGVDSGGDEAYLFLRDVGTADSRRLFGAFAADGLIGVPPVEYDDDGATFTLVGSDRAVQATVEAIPDRFDVGVERVGEPAPAIDSSSVLSDRQREAARIGVELGYFDVPRRASHEAVADELGCAPSTAAEHLQKAQSRLVRAAFE